MIDRAQMEMGAVFAHGTGTRTGLASVDGISHDPCAEQPRQIFQGGGTMSPRPTTTMEEAPYWWGSWQVGVELKETSTKIG